MRALAGERSESNHLFVGFCLVKRRNSHVKDKNARGLTNDSCLQKVAVINVIFNINNNGVFIRKGNAC